MRKIWGGALDGLLAQQFTDFDLILSDNASTDATADICADYAARDPRIVVVRQKENIGSTGNFHFVLEQARSEYFMWAAADDRWEPTYIDANISVLQEQANIVASVSRVRMGIPTHKAPSYIGTFPLTGTFEHKLTRYLAEPGQNSRFYGLFRADPLRQAFVPESFVAADWATVVRVLRFGDFHEVDNVLMSRGSHGESSRLHHYRRRRFRGRDSVFPLAEFTRWLWRELPPVLFARVLPQVLEQNARFTYAALKASQGSNSSDSNLVAR